ncbi:MAG: glycosyltransferase family 2 protein [Gammaproteobacteria bacterium]
MHSDEIWVRNGQRVNPGIRHRKRSGKLFHDCLRLCCISPSAVMVQRGVFSEIGLFDKHLPVCEDYDMWLRIGCRLPVLYVDEPRLVKHGGHPDQLSRRYRGMDRYRVIALHKLLCTQTLRVEDRHAAAAALLHKARIYVDGAIKRGRFRQAGEIEELMDRHRGEASSLSRPPAGAEAG